MQYTAGLYLGAIQPHLWPSPCFEVPCGSPLLSLVARWEPGSWPRGEILWALQGGWSVQRVPEAFSPMTYLLNRILKGWDLLLQVVQAPTCQIVGHGDCLGQKHAGWRLRLGAVPGVSASGVPLLAAPSHPF